MKPINSFDDVVNARYEIEAALIDSADWRLLVGDDLIGPIRDNYEFNVEWGKLIFSWWDEERSNICRISAYETGKAEIRLRASRGVGHQTSILTLRDEGRWRELRNFENFSREEIRRSHAGRLAELIVSKYRDAKILNLTTGANRSRAIPGRYARIVLQLDGEVVLAIGVSGDEEQAEIDGVIVAGIAWAASYNERRDERRKARRLWLLLPRDRSQTAIERLTFIDISHLGARAECFEADEDLHPLRPFTQCELLNGHSRELKWPERVSHSNYLRERIFALAGDSIETRLKPGQDEQLVESFLINGLEFAQIRSSDPSALRIGVAGLRDERRSPKWVKFSESTLEELKILANDIVKYRSGKSPNRRHSFYRLRSEAWLESILRRDIHSLDISFDRRFVYSQIPAWRADERSVIDLLTINHEGRLAVIEIKTAEDLQLPLQGLDYWLRIEQARLSGELIRRGLFDGVTIADQPPLLYLVAPQLRFHRSFKVVAGCLSPQIEAYQIGVNSNWREGVKIHSIEKLTAQKQ